MQNKINGAPPEQRMKNTRARRQIFLSSTFPLYLPIFPGLMKSNYDTEAILLEPVTSLLEQRLPTPTFAPRPSQFSPPFQQLRSIKVIFTALTKVSCFQRLQGSQQIHAVLYALTIPFMFPVVSTKHVQFKNRGNYALHLTEPYDSFFSQGCFQVSGDVKGALCKSPSLGPLSIQLGPLKFTVCLAA